MTTSTTDEIIDLRRRRILSTAAMGVAAFGAATVLTPGIRTPAAGEAVRPFRIDVPEELLIDLRRRVAATRWPDKETVADPSQGVQLKTVQQLAQYWQNGYSWRNVEARLNGLPQFNTEID